MSQHATASEGRPSGSVDGVLFHRCAKAFHSTTQPTQVLPKSWKSKPAGSSNRTNGPVTSSERIFRLHCRRSGNRAIYLPLRIPKNSRVYRADEPLPRNRCGASNPSWGTKPKKPKNQVPLQVRKGGKLRMPTNRVAGCRPAELKTPGGMQVVKA